MQAERRIAPLRIENARLVLKNFAGKGSEFNREGERNFGVLINDEDVNAMLDDGWNIRRFKAKPDDPDRYEQPWLKVKVRFDNYPPTAVLIANNRKIRLTEDTIDQLDWTRMKSVDLVISPYSYPARPGIPAGVAAYLKAIYVTVMTDDFEEKYADIPEV